MGAKVRPLTVDLLKKTKNKTASLALFPQAATSPSSSGVFGKLCLKRRVDPGGGGSTLLVQIYRQGWMHGDGGRIRIHKERRVKKVLG